MTFPTTSFTTSFGTREAFALHPSHAAQSNFFLGGRDSNSHVFAAALCKTTFVFFTHNHDRTSPSLQFANSCSNISPSSLSSHTPHPDPSSSTPIATRSTPSLFQPISSAHRATIRRRDRGSPDHPRPTSMHEKLATLRSARRSLALATRNPGLDHVAIRKELYCILATLRTFIYLTHLSTRSLLRPSLLFSKVFRIFRHRCSLSVSSCGPVAGSTISTFVFHFSTH